MNHSQIGVTLFNLREYCKTESDLDHTLGRVRDIGYQNIQVSGIGPIPPEKVRVLADKHGLKIIASHENMRELREDFDGVVNKLKAWDCDFTALGFPGLFDWTAESVPAFLAELKLWGEKMLAHGIRFGYHNHQHEFEKFNGRTLLAQIYEDLSSSSFFAELDVHWVTRGGGDPCAWIHKVNGRMPVIHFKDFAIVKSEPKFCEIGEGQLNWPAIIKACKATNVSYMVVEQDATFGDKDIFKSIKISYNNLLALGLH
jgi:sugar phosphate isomerase/epimerase